MWWCLFKLDDPDRSTVLCYPSHPLKIHGRNGDRSSGDPLGNGRHYLHRSGGCGGPLGTPGGGTSGPPMFLMEFAQVVPLLYS